jgi:hypothetical protein
MILMTVNLNLSDGFEGAIMQSIHTHCTPFIQGDRDIVDCHMFCFGSSSCSAALSFIRGQMHPNTQ